MNRVLRFHIFLALNTYVALDVRVCWCGLTAFFNGMLSLQLENVTFMCELSCRNEQTEQWSSGTYTHVCKAGL